MKKHYTAACSHCGQVRSFEHKDELSVMEQEAYVTSKCTCEAATRQRKIDKTYENLPKIVGKPCMEHGFDYELGDDTVEAIKRLVVDIVDDRIRRITLVEPNGDTLKMVDGGDRIKIERVTKCQMTI